MVRKGKIRWLAALLTIVVLGGTFSFPASFAASFSDTVGDVDGDGEIALRDAAIVSRYLAGWTDYSDEEGNIKVPDSLSEGFSVGYCREDITPDLSFYKRFPLAGYGNEDGRLATGVPDGDGICATCIAVRDENGETLLLFSLDLVVISEELTGLIRQSVSRTTGVPEDYISITATHTHTGPHLSNTTKTGGFMNRYQMDMIRKMSRAAAKACNNLIPATLWAGDTSVKDINFVRRYFVWYSDADGYTGYQSHTLAGDSDRWGYEGPNEADDGIECCAHETEADNEVQYILFKRSSAKDVLLFNWQCHPAQIGNNVFDLKSDGSYVGSYNSSSAPTNRIISADFINSARNVLESGGYLPAYFQGAAGNLNQFDYVSYSENKQIGSTTFSKYRLSGWSNSYYSTIYNLSYGVGNAGYWKSQMVGSIVADAVLKDLKKSYSAASTQNETFTDSWVGPRQLDTGNIGMTYTTYYTARKSNDSEIASTMERLSAIYNGTFTLQNSYKITYSGTTTTYSNDVDDPVRNWANQYGALTNDIERKNFAWNVLNTCCGEILSAGTGNMNQKAMRLKAYLATGLYIGSYLADNIRGSRNNVTDLTKMETDPASFAVPVRLYCYSIGRSVAFCMAPYEMFDTIGQEIKDGKYIRYNPDGSADTVAKTAARKHGTTTTYTKNGNKKTPFPTGTYGAAQYDYTDAKSPFALTFVCGYSNGNFKYVPTQYAWSHPESENGQNGYETYVAVLEKGTAEAHGDTFISMLNALYSGVGTAPAVAGYVQ